MDQKLLDLVRLDQPNVPATGDKTWEKNPTIKAQIEHEYFHGDGPRPWKEILLARLELGEERYKNKMPFVGKEDNWPRNIFVDALQEAADLAIYLLQLETYLTSVTGDSFVGYASEELIESSRDIIDKLVSIWNENETYGPISPNRGSEEQAARVPQPEWPRP